ncbi:MAG: hypothetical protein QF560_06680 [SAR324 cluster bacterium]|jgi:hypothetical protein|nr:hypothetical protein [Deltaproteobacteria bacterium]MDP6093397.1 hypothetical protein [SAR324 cluster bacterium]MBI11394.1 hypothetical protein [Deltaproteobacteria bacterium]MBP46073.1 hypothetical protein [Deltaproteobacteria bacterium]MDP6246793.1 hypothetical protein [SAR324 cluster bacterium]|tara:strand:+ start:1651 stop:2061 length:411 start_codon:yes stop_codon:yes gene_type:complete
MKWFKFETEEQQYREHEPEGMLIYLGPEALKHAIVVNDFEVFQSSPECVPGGRLLEVSRQFSYRLRQVADLVEEPLDQKAEVEPEQAPPSKEQLQEIESGEESIDQEFVDTSEFASRRADRNVDSISKNRKILKIS